MPNTQNILCEGVSGADGTRLNALLNILQSAISGDLAFSVSPATVASSATSSAWTRTVTISLVDSDGNVQTWFTKDITTGVSIADSSAGTATIPSTTLTFVNGVATVVISGNAASWAGGTKQVKTATIALDTAADGKVKMTVKGALLDEAVDVEVDVLSTDDTAAKVAAKCAAALTATEAFDGLYTFANVAGQATITITAAHPAADDDTIDLESANVGAGSIVTPADTAADTTPGVAPDTDTLTVAQATIVGYTVAAKTSVETFY